MKVKHYFAIGAAFVLTAGMLVAAKALMHKASFELEVESLTDLENPTWECDENCEDYKGETCDIVSVYGFPITCHDMKKPE